MKPETGRANDRLTRQPRRLPEPDRVRALELLATGCLQEGYADG